MELLSSSTNNDSNFTFASKHWNGYHSSVTVLLVTSFQPKMYTVVSREKIKKKSCTKLGIFCFFLCPFLFCFHLLLLVLPSSPCLSMCNNMVRYIIVLWVILLVFPRFFVTTNADILHWLSFNLSTLNHRQTNRTGQRIGKILMMQKKIVRTLTSPPSPQVID